MTGADVVAAARAMLGTRWMHQARIPGEAIDCAGLVICVGRKLGALPEDFDVNGYSRVPDGTMLDYCDRHLIRIPDLELGAVIVLRTDKEPQHMGIVADYRHGGWSVVHASAHAGKVVETRLMFARNFALRGVFRMHGLA